MATMKIKHFVETEISYNQKISQEEVIKYLVDNLKINIQDDNFEIKTINIVKGERDYDVLEVFDTMIKEFAEYMRPYVYDNVDVQKGLGDIYEKHKTNLERLEK